MIHIDTYTTWYIHYTLHTCRRVHICMYTHICIHYMHTYMHVNVCTYMYIHVCAHGDIAYICIQICCLYTYIYIYSYMYMHVNICKYMHICMHTATSHIHVYRYICFLISCCKHVKHIHTWQMYTYVCATKMRSGSKRPGGGGANDACILLVYCMHATCAYPGARALECFACIAPKGAIQVQNKTCILYSRNLSLILEFALREK